MELPQLKGSCRHSNLDSEDIITLKGISERPTLPKVPVCLVISHLLLDFVLRGDNDDTIANDR